MMVWYMLVVNLLNIVDMFEFGLYGWVLLCYLGVWVGFKVILEMVELGFIVDFDVL